MNVPSRVCAVTTICAAGDSASATVNGTELESEGPEWISLAMVIAGGVLVIVKVFSGANAEPANAVSIACTLQ